MADTQELGIFGGCLAVGIFDERLTVDWGSSYKSNRGTEAGSDGVPFDAQVSNRVISYESKKREKNIQRLGSN